MDFNEVIKNRRSVREFDGEPVTDEDLEKILELVNQAPSAGNLQAYEVLVVRNKEKKEALVEAAYGQDLLSEAEAVLVFVADRNKSGIKYNKRGEELYCVQDATIAAAYCELAATSLGIGSCWVGAFDPNEVRKIFNLSESQVPVALIPLGQYEKLPEPTSRRDVDDLVKKFD